MLASEPTFTLQYVSLANTQTGAEMSGSVLNHALALNGARTEGEVEDDAASDDSSLAMLSVAVKLGNTRLIDNVLLG